MLRRYALIALASASLSLPAGAQEAPISFNRQIRPILAENCFNCHGPDEGNRKGKFRLDTKEAAFAKLRDGSFAIVPGHVDKSELVARIHAEDSSLMPPVKSRKKLTPAEKELLKKWIAQGAGWSQHWAFEGPKKVSLPDVSNKTWPRNPVDHFILARLDREKLTPNAEADRIALIRRVTFDLTGLPPSPAEIDAFVADKAADAYEKVVERLLQSPHYGEHLGRFWLDAGRYGDTHGMHLDNFREMWPYRDWVIRAFNDNMPFDRFIVEQLAGDMLPGATMEQKIASGFNRLHVTTSEGGTIAEEAYVRNVVDRVDTTGTVFMGLSVGCARCHDHKFDPVSMKNYYQMFGFFNNLDNNPLDGNVSKYAPYVTLYTPAHKAKIESLDADIAGLKNAITAELAKVKDADLSDAKSKKPADDLEAWTTAQRKQPAKNLPDAIKNLVKVDAKKLSDAQRKELRDYFAEHVCARTRQVFVPLHEKLKPLQKERNDIEAAVPTTLVSQENPQPKPAYLLKRGDYDKRGDQVQPGIPEFLPPLPANAPRNRLAFAQWLVGREHPLTARVAVNRLWQQCFGTGLVKTAEDFGIQGEMPSHPRLLDWLAVQFMEDGWDVKKMLRRLVTSATYRQSARVSKALAARDPDNRLLARGPRIRLDAEMLRDQALFVSGLLVATIGGPSVKPPQPSGLWEAVAYTGSNTRVFKADTGHDKVHRRSLYTFWKRTAAPPQMATFDAPSREACTVRRERTNTPLQALLLMNEQQYVECARGLGQRAMKEAGTSTDQRLAHLFKLATGRTPVAAEMAELNGLYQESLAKFRGDAKAARALITLGETQPDPALDAAELAAFTVTANLVLNLDEVINR